MKSHLRFLSFIFMGSSQQAAVGDILSPGQWWHLADPYVLLPIALLAGMWKLQRKVLDSSQETNLS